MQNDPLGAFCNGFDLHLAIIGLEKQVFGLFESACFKQVSLYSSGVVLDGSKFQQVNVCILQVVRIFTVYLVNHSLKMKELVT